MQKGPARRKAAENNKKRFAGWAALPCLALAALLALPGTAEELAPEALEAETSVEMEIVGDEIAEPEEPREAEAIETAAPAAPEIRVDGAERDAEGVWRIPAGESAAFTWDCPDAETVTAAIYDADDALVWEGAPGAGSLLLANADWQESGLYRLHVTAHYPDGTEATAELVFVVVSDEDTEKEAEAEEAEESEAAETETSAEEAAEEETAEEETIEEETTEEEPAEEETTEDATTDETTEEETTGETAEEEDASAEETETTSGGKSSGKSSSGKSSGGSKSSGKSASGKSSGGKSSSGKASGKSSGKSTAKAEAETAEFAVPDGPVTALTLGEAELGISLDGGEASFTATLADAVLTLTPVGAGEEWRLSGEALSELYAQGIEAVALTLDGETWRVDTAEAAESDAGDADGDMPEALWIIDADGIRLRAGGLEFRWTAPADAE